MYCQQGQYQIWTNKLQELGRSFEYMTNESQRHFPTHNDGHQVNHSATIHSWKNDSDIMERWNTPVTMVSRSEHLHMISVYIANVANQYLSNTKLYSSVLKFYKHYQKDCCNIDPGSTIMWLVVMMGMRWSNEAVVPMSVLEMDTLNQTLNIHLQVLGNERLRHLK